MVELGRSSIESTSPPGQMRLLIHLSEKLCGQELLSRVLQAAPSLCLSGVFETAKAAGQVVKRFL
jgi:hypothetical protein